MEPGEAGVVADGLVGAAAALVVLVVAVLVVVVPAVAGKFLKNFGYIILFSKYHIGLIRKNNLFFFIHKPCILPVQRMMLFYCQPFTAT